jgi:hypothetical protein
MKRLLTHLTVFLLLLNVPILIYSQVVKFGALTDFVAYTGAGAATNSGVFKGNVGSNLGIISGFSGSLFTGTVHNADSLTNQAKVDILRVYIHLNDMFVTHPGTHVPSFGGGETLTPGIYSIPGAGSLAGTVNLDGQGDTNSVFIIKYEGALTTGVGAEVVLTKGTRGANVFWIAEGAITIASGCVIRGSLLCHAGAISVGTNAKITGKVLTTEGAITFAAGDTVIGPIGLNTIPLSCSGKFTPAAAADVLGSVADFALFTSLGAIANTASSGIIGDIATNGGSVSGFGSSTHIGSATPSAAIISQAKTDLDSAYAKLMRIAVTVSTHAAAFGSGETLKKGVYSVSGAGSLAGTITLDGENDPNAIFIFKFGGAFTAAAKSKVIFINGTRRCNVFWISEGATSMGTYTYMKGTVIANGGANNLAVGGFVEGRMLSTGGAIGLSAGVVFNDPLCFPSPGAALPIELSSFTATIRDEHVQIDWVTSAEINQDYFNVERSGSAEVINFNSISEIVSAGNSAQTLSYSALDHAPLSGVSYYRLKQTDYDGRVSYSNIKSVEFTNANDFIFEIYPNPFSDETVFHSDEYLEGASLVVYNSFGRVVKELKNISGQTFTFQREDLSSGLYFTKLLHNDKVIGTNNLVIIDNN